MAGVCLASGTAAAGNFPPVAAGAADPQEALVGEVIQFNSDASFDPDDGPSPLTFLWDFGDGSPTSTLPNPTHSYAALGFYVVSLTVSDGVAQALINLDVVALAPPSPVQPTHSSAIALTADDGTLAVVNPDSGSVSLVDTGDRGVVEVAVGADPRGLAWNADGSRLYVTCFGSNELWVLDGAGDVVEQLPVGHQPFGVAVSPADGRLVVTHEGDATVWVLDPSDLSELATADVEATPRAIAIPPAGDVAYVSHFLTRGDVGHVSVVDIVTGGVQELVTLAEDPGPDTSSSGGGFPSLLGAVAIDPGVQTLWIGGQKQNTGRGEFVNGLPLEPRNRIRGLLAPVDLAGGVEAMDLRLDTNDADSVSGVVFSPRGRYAYLTHQGAGMLSVYDIPAASLVDTSDGAAVNFAAREDTGDAPQGIAIASDGSAAYVHNFMSRDVAVFDLSQLAAPELVATIAVTDEPLDAEVARGKVMFYRSREPVHSDQNYIACAGCHPDGGQDGRTWDFTQVGEGLRNTIDLRGHGGTDHGPVHWSANFDEIQDFENDIQFGFGGEGLLGGGAEPYPPLDPMHNGGRSEDLDALAAYVGSLKTPPRSPYRQANGELTDAALRGYDIFFSEEAACAECHVPPTFTDSEVTEDVADFLLHDVGTFGPGSGMRLGGELPGIDTPTVLGVWATPPYLHDGSAATLMEVLTTRNPDDAHGKTSHLSEDELADLVEYMLSLQGSPDEHPELPPDDDTGGSESGTGDDTSGTGDTGDSTTGGVPPGTTGSVDPSAGGSTGEAGADEPAADGCGCSTGGGHFALVWLLALLGSRRRRR